MITSDAVVFNDEVWRPALEKFAAVTNLTVLVYGLGRQVVCGPTASQQLLWLLAEHQYDPAIFFGCRRQCLAPPSERPAVYVGTA